MVLRILDYEALAEAPVQRGRITDILTPKTSVVRLLLGGVPSSLCGWVDGRVAGCSRVRMRSRALCMFSVESDLTVSACTTTGVVGGAYTYLRTCVRTPCAHHCTTPAPSTDEMIVSADSYGTLCMYAGHTPQPHRPKLIIIAASAIQVQVLARAFTHHI